MGLYSTFFLGFITAVIGGKEGMISGAAGAMAVVIKDLMADSGPLSDYSKGDRQPPADDGGVASYKRYAAFSS